jgi:glycosyltransferase involved in cell wall biosynthesis
MNNSKPLVTVYITNYNYGSYIEEAIDSVLKQSYKNIEILIIDDGSTDDSKSIIENYSERLNIQAIYQANKGLTKTNNIALAMAKGNYIVRLDADDKFHADSIEKLVLGFNSDSVAMVFGNWNVVDESGGFLYAYKRHDFQKDVTLLDSPAHGACTMFRTDYLRSIGGYDEDLRCQDGYELWFRVIDKFEVKSLDEIIFDYRRHGNNLTGNEDRILSTRASILNKVAATKSKVSSKSFVFIPVRGSCIDSRSMPFQSLGGRFIIDCVLADVIESDIFDKVVISTPDEELIKYIEKKYPNNVDIHFRKASTAKINSSIDSVLHNYVKDSAELMSFNYGMILGIERPFNKAYLIQSALDIARIFNVDNVIGVRPSSDIFFNHSGSTLTGVNFSSDSLRLERDDMYQMVRGFNVFNVQNLLSKKSIWGGVVGHVVFDQKSALSIESNLDLRIAEAILKE